MKHINAGFNITFIIEIILNIRKSTFMGWKWLITPPRGVKGPMHTQSTSWHWYIFEKVNTLQWRVAPLSTAGEIWERCHTCTDATWAELKHRKSTHTGYECERRDIHWISTSTQTEGEVTHSNGIPSSQTFSCRTLTLDPAHPHSVIDMSCNAGPLRV